MTPKLTYTVAETAELLGISKGLAYQGIQNRTIPSLRIGRRILVSHATLQDWLQGEGVAR